jgi:hypothetical protein
VDPKTVAEWIKAHINREGVWVIDFEAVGGRYSSPREVTVRDDRLLHVLNREGEVLFQPDRVVALSWLNKDAKDANKEGQYL